MRNRVLWQMTLMSLSLVLISGSGVRTAVACPEHDELVARLKSMAPDKDKKKPKKKSKKDESDDADPEKVVKEKIRWGQRRSETDAEYDKRYEKVLKRTRLDKKRDFTGGAITNGRELVRLWTFKGYPFIVRTDISQEFTADTVMYMEMLHRDYGAAYKKFLGIPSQIKEPIEVIVFADRATYMRNGGSPGSGGQFMPFIHLLNDRGPSWKARHFRLMQFTSGIRDFAKWEKGTLKHEAAHMELQMRLGMTLLAGYKIGIPVQAPRWFNEGHASVFEFWDFDKDVDENLAEVADRGRYAPVIRRIFETDRWQDFDYVWKINANSWARDMTSSQGFLNYAQSWSLAAYMMTSGVEGRKHFRAIFDLSRRVGVDYQTTMGGETTLAWQEAFPEDEQADIAKGWTKWVRENVRRDKTVPDEEFFLRRMGVNPKILDRMEPFVAEDDIKKNAEWVEKEMKRRKKSNVIEK